MNGLLRAASEFVLADAPEVRARCAELSGKLVVVELTDLELDFCIRPRDGGLDITQESSSEADARIRGRSIDLLRMARGGRAGSDAAVQVEGDAVLVEDLRKLMRDVDWDAEEHVARLLGDAPAHELGRFVRGVHHVASDAVWRLAGMGAEFLKFESRDLPRPDEVEEFVVAVDRLRDDVERAAARMHRIEEGDS